MEVKGVASSSAMDGNGRKGRSKSHIISLFSSNFVSAIISG